MSTTSNTQREPEKDAKSEVVADKSVNQSDGQPSREQQDDGISLEEFSQELRKPLETTTPKLNQTAKIDHESKMLIASARISKLSREKTIDKSEAALELLDDGIISQDQANFLLKRDFGGAKQQQEAAIQPIDKNQLKAEMRAEDKLLEVVKQNKLSKTQAQTLIDEYKQRLSVLQPEEAADFALFKANITTGEEIKQDELTRPSRGSSPTTPTPQPKEINSSTIANMSLEEYEKLRTQEMKELQDMQDRGMA